MSELLAQLSKRRHGSFTITGELTAPLGRFHVTALFGPSGSGKTTWLRLLAGLERPDEGLIRFGSEIWFDSQQGICLSPQQRDIGFLFQSYALFPHLTAEQNIAFGLHALPRQERRRRTDEMLVLVQLERKTARISASPFRRGTTTVSVGPRAGPAAAVIAPGRAVLRA
jgi:molybdate transport system ATP-binding protein